MRPGRDGATFFCGMRHRNGRGHCDEDNQCASCARFDPMAAVLAASAAEASAASAPENGATPDAAAAAAPAANAAAADDGAASTQQTTATPSAAADNAPGGAAADGAAAVAAGAASAVPAKATAASADQSATDVHLNTTTAAEAEAAATAAAAAANADGTAAAPPKPTVGMHVLAQYAGWYKGEVAAVHAGADGGSTTYSYDIHFDDGDVESGMAADRVRLGEGAVAAEEGAKFAVGTKVEAQYQDVEGRGPVNRGSLAQPAPRGS